MDHIRCIFFSCCKNLNFSLDLLFLIITLIYKIRSNWSKVNRSIQKSSQLTYINDLTLVDWLILDQFNIILRVKGYKKWKLRESNLDFFFEIFRLFFYIKKTVYNYQKHPSWPWTSCLSKFIMWLLITKGYFNFQIDISTDNFFNYLLYGLK